ncbi:MAG TPA: class I SAM-dependent methyltransferase [Bacillota bacterium]|nr:class I SAM-dependent methyltransferase [Bacillota bacterium]
MDEQIYHQPENYDLEHAQAEPDIGFFVGLLEEWRPQRVLELACGNGRVSFALARRLARWGGGLTGLDTSEPMLEAARRKAGESAEAADRQIHWIAADMRTWRAQEPFDLIVCPCASMSHLLALEDQIAAWQRAWENLVGGGRFVVAEQMANLPILAESQQNPPRAVVELDSDTVRTDGRVAERLVRYRATRYFAHEQRASVHFLYDKLHDESAVTERFVSDYECHVFYPRELQLLFLLAGFRVERLWGNYQRGRLGEASTQLIVAGTKPQKE